MTRSDHHLLSGDGFGSTHRINLNRIRNETEETGAICGGLMITGPIPSVTPHFSDLENVLIDYISAAEYVVGCVAWLTNPNLMAALKRKSGIKLIVNQETYLEGELLDQVGHHRYLRRQYQTMPDLGFNDNMSLLTEWIDESHLQALQTPGAILAHGVSGSSSRMHNKFLIFLDSSYHPLGVWTGSYNMSINSNNCLENAVFLTDLWISRQYLVEFFMILKHSIPLSSIQIN